MAVQNQIPFVEYIANGQTNTFPLNFKCSIKAELIVYINDVETTFSEWSLLNNNIVFITNPQNGDKITAKRQTKLERETDFKSSDNSFRPDVLNNDFDRLWYAVQDLNFGISQDRIDVVEALEDSAHAVQTAENSLEIANNANEAANDALTEIQPIVRGGTGGTTAEEARTNLNVYSKTESNTLFDEKLNADQNLADLPSKTTARANLNVYSQAEVNALIASGGEGSVIGVGGGGTGGTTAEEARTNLNVYSKTESNTLFDEKLNADQNLADLPDKTTARNNLNVYSKSQVASSISAATPPATETTVGQAKIATTVIAQEGTNDTDIITAKKLREAVNCPSELKPFSCVAWLSVDTTTTPPTIQGSGNVASVTLLSTGRLRVNFSMLMPDTNYAPIISLFNNTLGNGAPNYFTIIERLTTSVTIATGSRDAGASVAQNYKGIYLGVFR